MSNIIQYVATSNILPCRFLTMDGSVDAFAVKTASSATPTSAGNNAIVGISAEGTTVVPIEGYTDASSIYAATPGLPVPYWGEHDECLLMIGGNVTYDEDGSTPVDTIAPGDLLTTDAEGRGIKATTDGQWVGARALMPGKPGDKIRVVVECQRTFKAVSSEGT